jgi:hypothetical protein
MVSLGVVASPIFVALGAPIAEPTIALIITAMTPKSRGRAGIRCAEPHDGATYQPLICLPSPSVRRKSRSRYSS